MKSIQVIAEATAGIQEVPVPTIPDGWLLVKTKALGVNPTDFKHIDWNLGGVGARCGCDYAGIVEELGTGTTGFQKGDRIAGFCHGG
jgi:NADPH:quinone reductase-like Zn-dependent oxidoreductase